MMIYCLLICMLAFSAVSASGATSRIGESAQSTRVRLTLTTISDRTIEVKWTRGKPYTNYDLYRKAAEGKTYKKVASIKGTSYSDKGLKKNTLYQYKVRPFRYTKGKKSYGKYSAESAASTGVNTKDYTLNLTLPADDKSGMGIEVKTADRSVNKKAVILYRSTSKAGPYERIKELAVGKSFRDTTVERDTSYYYKIKACKVIGKENRYSVMSAFKMVRTMPNWTLHKLTYSNLTDPASRQETADLLKKGGIRESYIEEVMALAEDYHQVVGGQPFFQQGFTTIDGRSVDYDISDTYTPWTESRDYADVNCRITAMTLFRDYITTGAAQKADPFLAMDTDAMENYPLCKIDGADRHKFYTLFNPVSLKTTTDSDAVLAAVQKEWKARGISFRPAAASMVSVLCCDELDQMAFVGHTGIMIQAEGRVLYLEKIASTSPLQVSQFQSRSQVKEYLLDKYWNFYAPGVCAPPVIMENDQAF